MCNPQRFSHVKKNLDNINTQFLYHSAKLAKEIRVAGTGRGFLSL